MNWLSKEEIKRRAAISEEEALNVSIEEWEDKVGVIRVGEFVRIRTGGSYCGLCSRHTKNGQTCCAKCILYEDYEGRNCCREYKTFLDCPTRPNAQAMLNRLYMERGKRYGKEPKKECKTEKPKEIRHGDYEIDRNGRRLIWLQPKNCGGLDACFSDGLGGSIQFPNDNKLVLGNIFDDLKRNSEDLEEFKVQSCGATFQATLHDENIEIRVNPPFFLHKDVADIGRNLLRMVATAKRREAKKDC